MFPSRPWSWTSPLEREPSGQKTRWIVSCRRSTHSPSRHTTVERVLMEPTWRSLTSESEKVVNMCWAWTLAWNASLFYIFLRYFDEWKNKELSFSHDVIVVGYNFYIWRHSFKILIKHNNVTVLASGHQALVDQNLVFACIVVLTIKDVTSTRVGGHECVKFKASTSW